jgi:hypothetical protein
LFHFYAYSIYFKIQLLKTRKTKGKPNLLIGSKIPFTYPRNQQQTFCAHEKVSTRRSPIFICWLRSEQFLLNTSVVFFAFTASGGGVFSFIFGVSLGGFASLWVFLKGIL